MRTSLAVLTLLFASLLLLAGCSIEQKSMSNQQQDSTPNETSTIEITSSDGTRTEVEVEIADDDAKRQRGLMERTALAENAGMLFVFDREKPLSFWMKDTLIPLSIAYIDSGGRIVDLQDMQPLDETSHPSAKPAKYALEVNQGFFREHGVEVGNMVELPELPSVASPPSSTEVVQAFRDAGLEIGESYPVEQEPGWDEKPVPRTYEEATRFTVPSLGADAGGRVFVFKSEGDLAAVRDYYEGLERSVRPYVYDEGLVLVQISNQLPEDEAEKYWTVLKEAV